jgi:hypothetical protein
MQDQSSWDDCPAGLVTDMAGQLRRRKRHVQLRAVISISLAVLLSLAVGYGLKNRDEPAPRARLNCRDAVPLFAEYHDKKLDAVVASDVREHLSRCPKCREHYEDLYPNEVRNRSSGENRVVAVIAPTHR